MILGSLRTHLRSFDFLKHGGNVRRGVGVAARDPKDFQLLTRGTTRVRCREWPKACRTRSATAVAAVNSKSRSIKGLYRGRRGNP